MKIQQLDSRTYRLIKNIRIAVLTLGTAILVFACKDNEIDRIQAFVTPEELPVLEAVDFETLSTDSGQVRFSLKAPKLLQFENNGKNYYEFPMGIEMLKYDVNKNVISSLRADYAKQFVKEENWEAKNNVELTNANGDTLKTEHLMWEEKSGKIYTEEFVKIISPDKVITGIGLTSNQDMTDWEIKNVKGIIYVAVDNDNKTTKPVNEDTPDAEPPILEQPTQQTIKFK